MINCIHEAVQLNLTVLTHVPGAIFKTSFSIIFFFQLFKKSLSRSPMKEELNHVPAIDFTTVNSITINPIKNR